MNHRPNSEQPQTTPKPASVEAEAKAQDLTPKTQDLTPDLWNLAPALPALPARYQKEPLISFVRNILLASPFFPKFYADVVLHSAPNSPESKILRPQYQKLLLKVQQAIQSMAPTKTCTHIKVTGVRCGSPALYGERFCYFHQNAHRGVRKPPQSRLHPIAILEDEESIQSSLMEVINSLMRNTIDLKRAELILRALHIAVKNSRRVKFSSHSDEMIREVPDYPDLAPDQEGVPAYGGPGGVPAASPISEPQVWAEEGHPGDEDELPAVAAMKPQPVHPDPEFWERSERGGQLLKRKSQAEAQSKPAANAAVGHVGTAAIGRPASEASAVPAHNFKTQSCAENAPAAKPSVPEGRPKVAQRFSAGKAATPETRAVGTPEPQAQSKTPPRKPPATSPVPKERKNAAHAVRHG